MDREPGCTCTIDGTYWPPTRSDDSTCPLHGRQGSSVFADIHDAMVDMLASEGAALNAERSP